MARGQEQQAQRLSLRWQLWQHVLMSTAALSLR
jgi:hypothetical protein